MNQKGKGSDGDTAQLSKVSSKTVHLNGKSKKAKPSEPIQQIQTVTQTYNAPVQAEDESYIDHTGQGKMIRMVKKLMRIFPMNTISSL